MEKNLNYYLALNYPVEIIKIEEDKGGGYQACIPMLGRYAFLGDGETVAEALADLEDTKKYLFQEYLEKGLPILEPDQVDEKEYSGRFILRIPAELHRYLSLEAKRNATTLNQYCLYMLTRKSYLKNIGEELTELRKDMKKIYSGLFEVKYSFEPDLSISSENKVNNVAYMDKKGCMVA